MKVRERIRQLRYLKNPDKIPEHIKKAFKEHPLRQAIEFKTKQMVIDKVDYWPIENALKKAIEKKKLNRINKRVLGNLIARLQKGKGYTTRTRKAFEEQLPQVIERACKHNQTEKDIKDLQDLREWLKWHKKQETAQILFGGK